MNVAYKHLNAKLRIGDLTAGQWAAVLLGIVLMLGWGFYLSPFGTYPTLISAVYVGGVPVSLGLLAGYAELNVWRLATKAFAWGHANGAYAAGPGDRCIGYALSPDPRADQHACAHQRPALDLATLWE